MIRKPKIHYASWWRVIQLYPKLLIIKIIFFLFIIFFSKPSLPKDIYVLVIGQSISANCNGHIFGEKNGVYQITKTGGFVPAKDPFDWSDCFGGSMWLPLGEEIIKSDMGKRVFFMPIGVPATKANDWLVGGKAFDKLNSALLLIKNKGFVFNFALWHQGSSDFGVEGNLYSKQVVDVINYVNSSVKVDKWIIAQHSKCYGNFDENIARQQRIIGSMISKNFYPGPDTNALGDDFRIDGCHLNKLGQMEMARLWFLAIKNANVKIGSDF